MKKFTSKNEESSVLVPSRRKFLGMSALAASAAAFPHIWVPRAARAATPNTGTVKHLIFIRLAGGFRFPCAFNGDVAEQFNPFGLAGGVPDGVQWGVSRLLAGDGFLGEEGVRDLGMKSVSSQANRITVMPAVDHEPLAGGADGNHETGLERCLTGFVGGEAGIFTRIQLGLKKRYDEAFAAGKLILPPFVMGNSNMARGLGIYAPHRPPVLSGATFDRFNVGGAGVPDWATTLVKQTDSRMQLKQHPALRERIGAYIRSRDATEQYGVIFGSEELKIDNNSTKAVDGISNTDLRTAFGNSGESQNIRLGLRLLHHGCPAIYLDQGGYDYHSGEEENLPGAIERLNRLLSGLLCVLPKMQHPEGGSYWDHTVVVLASEFSRTSHGGRFNSARGSDHNGDYSTRWMSMPFFGGPVKGGRLVGASTRKEDLRADGTVFSYRATMNTLLDALGCDESVFFPGDGMVDGLLGEVA